MKVARGGRYIKNEHSCSFLMDEFSLRKLAAVYTTDIRVRFNATFAPTLLRLTHEAKTQMQVKRMLDRCLTAQLTATLKKMVCVFCKLKRKTQIKSLGSLNKVLFYYLSTWISKNKLLSKYLKLVKEIDELKVFRTVYVYNN